MWGNGEMMTKFFMSKISQQFATMTCLITHIYSEDWRSLAKQPNVGTYAMEHTGETTQGYPYNPQQIQPSSQTLTWQIPQLRLDPAKLLQANWSTNMNEKSIYASGSLPTTVHLLSITRGVHVVVVGLSCFTELIGAELFLVVDGPKKCWTFLIDTFNFSVNMSRFLLWTRPGYPPNVEVVSSSLHPQLWEWTRGRFAAVVLSHLSSWESIWGLQGRHSHLNKTFSGYKRFGGPLSVLRPSTAGRRAATLFDKCMCS